MKRNLVQEVMSERCIYGGLLASRAEVHSDLMTLTRQRGEKINHNFIDRLTWMPPKATDDQIAHLTACGATLANLRRLESDN